MLKHIPECHQIELALVPVAGSQSAFANIKPKLPDDHIHQAAVVLNGTHVPTGAVRCQHKVAGATSDFEQLVAYSISL